MLEQSNSSLSKSAFTWTIRANFPYVTAERGRIVATTVAVVISALFTLQPELVLAYSRLFFDRVRFSTTEIANGLARRNHIQR